MPAGRIRAAGITCGRHPLRQGMSGGGQDRWTRSGP